MYYRGTVLLYSTRSSTYGTVQLVVQLYCCTVLLLEYGNTTVDLPMQYTLYSCTSTCTGILLVLVATSYM